MICAENTVVIMIVIRLNVVFQYSELMWFQGRRQVAENRKSVSLFLSSFLHGYFLFAVCFSIIYSFQD